MSEPSAQQAEYLEIARRGYEAYNARDLEALLAISHEECEVYSAGSSYRGHAGYRRWFHDWLESFEDDYRVEVLETHFVGERHLVVNARQHATGKGSGVPVTMDSGNLYEFRDGKIIALYLYANLEDALAVAKLRESGEPDAREPETDL